MQILVVEQKILNCIHVVRGQKIMFDADLAKMYKVETRRLNEQVKRNINRFPKDFMFTLSEKEFVNLMSHFATSSFPGDKPSWGGRRKRPNVFTEHGVAMLSSILNSDIAIAVNIRIIRVFTKIREYTSADLNKFINLNKLGK